MRIAGLVFVAILTLPAIGLLGEEDAKKDNNKEAPVSSIADNLQPEVRDQIADLLAQELERVTTTREAEEKELEDLRAKVKKQEAKIAQSKLTAKFIKERLEQWRPTEETEEFRFFALPHFFWKSSDLVAQSI